MGKQGYKAEGKGWKGKRVKGHLTSFILHSASGVKVATLDGGLWPAERAIVPTINQFHAQHCVCPDFSC